jgi:hypothetical protein
MIGRGIVGGIVWIGGAADVDAVLAVTRARFAEVVEGVCDAVERSTIAVF